MPLTQLSHASGILEVIDLYFPNVFPLDLTVIGYEEKRALPYQCDLIKYNLPYSPYNSSADNMQFII